MSRLRELLAAHAPLLLIDAASQAVQVGVLSATGETTWHRREEEASVAVFAGVAACGRPLSDIRGFIFCEGPGSILGIRTAAMAIRTWNVLQPRPVFTYSSLALVAHALGDPMVAVIADARRDSWHHYQLGPGLRRIVSQDLPAGERRVMPSGFRHWTPLPPEVTQVPYEVPELLTRAADADLFTPTSAPDAFLHEEPSYVTWTPQIHRAPSSA